MSRISGARFCLFLSDSSIVNRLVDEVKVLSVEGHIIKISPLVTKAKKVIISNATPVISNTAIKRFLTSERGIRTFSSVTELKANSGGDARLTAVGSFRRQIFIHPEDERKLPITHQFEVAGKKYNVFFTTDKPICFRCKSTGHFAKDCKMIIPAFQDDMMAEEEEEETELTASGEQRKLEQLEDKSVPKNNTTDQAELSKTDIERQTSASSTAASPTPVLDNAVNHEVLLLHAVNKTNTAPLNKSLLPVFAGGTTNVDKTKRAHSVISDNSSSVEIFEGDGQVLAGDTSKIKPPPKPAKKAKVTVANSREERKRQIISELPGHLTSAKKFIDENFENKIYLIGFDDVVQLLKKTTGKNGVSKRAITESFCKNTDSVLELLDNIYQRISDSGTKNKITRLKTALKSADSNEPDSDCSLSSVK